MAQHQAGYFIEGIKKLFVKDKDFDKISGTINIMVIAILLDLILGLMCAMYLGEAIQSKKLWRTVYKLFIAIGLIMLLYAVQTEIGVIDGADRGMALLIIGFEIWSILESAGKITDHRLFRILQRYMVDRVKETTGIDISKDKKNETEA